MFTCLAGEAKVRFDDEFHASIAKALGKFFELVIFQACSEVSDWHFITIDWVEKVLSAIVFSNPVTNKLVTIKVIILPLF